MQASNDWEQWTEQEVTLIMFSCKWSRRRFVILMRETLERSEENVLVFVFVSLSFSLPCRCLGGGAGVGPVPLHTSLEQYGMNLRNRRQLLLLDWGLRPSRQWLSTQTAVVSHNSDPYSPLYGTGQTRPSKAKAGKKRAREHFIACGQRNFV